MQSPCIKVCRLDDNKVCIGCLRSIDEIVAWKKLSAEEQKQILSRVKEEKARRESRQNLPPSG